MECSIGLMVHIMRANGSLTKLTDKVHFGMRKVMYIKENSNMIWPTGMESILISTEASTKETS